MTDESTGTSAGADSRQDLLDRAWDEAADGYLAYFEPRFRPWIEDAVAALHAASPAPGTLVVPGCGNGLELCLLAAVQPEHFILGIDPAAGMCRNARDRTRALPRVMVHREDGTRTATWPRPCGGVLSCFTLQLLADPVETLAAWMEALEPGGVLSVVFWPGDVERTGPFAAVRQILESRVPPRDRAWETGMREAISGTGGSLLRDATVAHAMRHPDAGTFWEAMVDSGPLHALLLSRGESFMEDARRAFMQASPAGELVHRPQARLLVARRE